MIGSLKIHTNFSYATLANFACYTVFYGILIGITVQIAKKIFSEINEKKKSDDIYTFGEKIAWAFLGAASIATLLFVEKLRIENYQFFPLNLRDLRS